MPLTCSHPAAILPFKRFKQLNFAALIIGSMSPDIGYFTDQRHLAKLAHHPSGTFLICLPSGLIVLALFYLLRRDLTYMLPNPHRNQLMPLANQKPRWTFDFFLAAAISIIIGAWTHIVWDQFTHDGSFAARHFPPLNFVLFHVRTMEITVGYSLQYISTLVGGAILAWYYWTWLRAQPPKPTMESDTWRYLLTFTIGVISLIGGYAIARHFGDAVIDFKSLREFIYDMAVSSISIFTPTFGICAVLLYRRTLGRDGCDPSHGTGQK